MIGFECTVDYTSKISDVFFPFVSNEQWLRKILRVVGSC